MNSVRSSTACLKLYCFSKISKAINQEFPFKREKHYIEKKIHRFLISFGVLNKADVFLELSCFLDDPVDVGNLISGSSAFSKTSLNIWKSMLHVLLFRSHLKRP